MSIALATKGVIAQFAPAGGGYPVYTPMEEPTVGTEEVGAVGIHPTSLDVAIRGKPLKPKVRPIELKPKMKAD